MVVGNREMKGGKPRNSRGRRWMWEKEERQKWALKQRVSPTPFRGAGASLILGHQAAHTKSRIRGDTQLHPLSSPHPVPD